MGRRQGHHHVDDVVVRDDREAVRRLQHRDPLEDRVAGQLDLLSGHRPRAVEHEGHVHGRTRLVPVGHGGYQRDGDVTDAATGGADERSVGTGGQFIHECSFISARASSSSRSNLRFITRESGRRTWSSISGARRDALPLGALAGGPVPCGGRRRWRRARRQAVPRRAFRIRRFVAGQHRSDVVRRALLLWRRGFSAVFGALGQLAQLVLRQPFDLLADFGERQVLVLQLADQSKAVPVDLAVPRAAPGAIGGREQALLDVEIDRPGGDAGVVAEGLEVELSHSRNITVTSVTVNIYRRQLHD